MHAILQLKIKADRLDIHFHLKDFIYYKIWHQHLIVSRINIKVWIKASNIPEVCKYCFHILLFINYSNFQLFKLL